MRVDQLDIRRHLALRAQVVLLRDGRLHYIEAARASGPTNDQIVRLLEAVRAHLADSK